MNEIKVSIIVPLLNAEQYLKECINSISKQTLHEIEIICVDAGSMDHTYDILLECQRCDDRIHILHSDVKSYGHQVNLGMDTARGQYIGIVESDDKVEPMMYEKLFSAAEKENADFVKADFYGIVSDANGQEIKYYKHILSRQEDYNRIINIRGHQECFRPDLCATWSGIYRKRFLDQYGIRHNDTKGASFQDTGFLIQTYIFAERAYFLNAAFYCYRQDNPKSSTYQLNKVYCICDEMEFICCLFEKTHEGKDYGEKLAWLFFRKYKRNLERVPEEEKTHFYERFAKDFQIWNSKFSVTGIYFSGEEWSDLVNILENPTAYYHEMLKARKRFLEEVGREDKIIIYGAGRVGRFLAGKIAKEKIAGFAVTNKECQQIEDIPVYNIDELNNRVKDVVLLIAAKISDMRLEMIHKAEDLGFLKVIPIPYGMFDI